jgi:hypothetical protein
LQFAATVAGKKRKLKKYGRKHRGFIQRGNSIAITGSLLGRFPVQAPHNSGPLSLKCEDIFSVAVLSLVHASYILINITGYGEPSGGGLLTSVV